MDKDKLFPQAQSLLSAFPGIGTQGNNVFNNVFMHQLGFNQNGAPGGTMANASNNLPGMQSSASAAAPWSGDPTHLNWIDQAKMLPMAYNMLGGISSHDVNKSIQAAQNSEFYAMPNAHTSPGVVHSQVSSNSPATSSGRHSINAPSSHHSRHSVNSPATPGTSMCATSSHPTQHSSVQSQSSQPYDLSNQRLPPLTSQGRSTTDFISGLSSLASTSQSSFFPALGLPSLTGSSSSSSTSNGIFPNLNATASSSLFQPIQPAAYLSNQPTTSSHQLSHMPTVSSEHTPPQLPTTSASTLSHSYKDESIATSSSTAPASHSRPAADHVATSSHADMNHSDNQKPSTSTADADHFDESGDLDDQLDLGFDLTDDFFNLSGLVGKDADMFLKELSSFEPSALTSGGDMHHSQSQEQHQPPVEEVEGANSKLERLLSNLRQTQATIPPAHPFLSTGQPSGLTAFNAPASSSAIAAPPAPLPRLTNPSAGHDSPLEFTPPDSPVASSSNLHDAGATIAAAAIGLTGPVKKNSPLKTSVTPGDAVNNASNVASTSKAKSPVPPPPKQPMFFVPQPRTTFQRPATIPIWKKSTDIFTSSSDAKDKDDAFTFTDDDEEAETDHSKDKKEEGEDVTPTVPAPAAPKYIPGRGFDFEEQDMGKNKRDVRKATQPPPVAAEVKPVKEQVKSETAAFTERIHQRLMERIGKGFVDCEKLSGNDCAKEEKVIDLTDVDRPPLPRLLIRLPKKSEETESAESKRRRKRNDESDDEWHGSDRRPKKKRGRKPKNRVDETTYSVRLVDPSTLEEEHQPKEQDNNGIYFNKKRRFLKNWNRENEEEATAVPHCSNGVLGDAKPEQKSIARIVSDFKNAAVRNRLSKFSACNINVPKNTFLVLKADIFKSDCALWRVDNQNLLQKFPGRLDPKNPSRIVYKNSSTYSGWCEQTASSYLVVTIKYIRHSRSDTIVEPEVPIADLIPAITDDSNETFTGVKRLSSPMKEDADAQTDARMVILKDTRMKYLYMYMKDLLDRALTFDFFTPTGPPELAVVDWNPVLPLDEIEKCIEECFSKIRDRVTWNDDFTRLLERYSSLTSTESTENKISCQACGSRSVERVIQLFLLANYNPKTMELLSKESIDGGKEEKQKLPAAESLVCATCCQHAQWFHRLLHFKFHLVQTIEERMCEALMDTPSLAPDQVVDQLRQSYIWIKRVVSDITEFWQTVLSSSE